MLVQLKRSGKVSLVSNHFPSPAYFISLRFHADYVSEPSHSFQPLGVQKVKATIGHATEAQCVRD